MYAEEAQFLLIDFRKKAKPHSCRTNFRNMELISRFAMLFQWAKGDVSQITVVSDRVSKGKPVDLLLEFDRPGGSLPALKRIDESELDAIPEESSDYPYSKNALMVGQYRELMEGELREMAENQRPRDLLIPVPWENSPEATWVRDALESASIPFLDYSREANRRSAASEHLVRVCTFHSSSGIEGQRVLVFGFERLDQLASLRQSLSDEARIYRSLPS